MMRYWNFDWDDQTSPDDLVSYTQGVLDTLGTRGIMLEMQVPSATNEEAIKLAEQCQTQGWLSN
jgi:hypothetical protein